MGQVEEYGGDFVITDEFDAKRDKMGLWTGTQTFAIRERRLGELMPNIGSKHPKFGWMSLGDASITGEKGGWIMVQGQYSGVQFTGKNPVAADAEKLAEYSLGVSVSEEPLQTLFKYVDTLTEKDIQEVTALVDDPPKDEHKNLIEVDQSGWPELKKELYDLLRRGVESYRDPKITWSKTWVSTERQTDLNEIGKIADPHGKPPKLAGGRNWLTTEIRSDERVRSIDSNGDEEIIFENFRSWEASGLGGWLEPIYGA